MIQLKWAPPTANNSLPVAASQRTELALVRPDREALAVRAEGQGADFPAQAENDLPGGGVPDAQEAVGRGAGHEPAVGAEGRRAGGAAVQLTHDLPGGHLPDPQEADADDVRRRGLDFRPSARSGDPTRRRSSGLKATASKGV